MNIYTVDAHEWAILALLIALVVLCLSLVAVLSRYRARQWRARRDEELTCFVCAAEVLYRADNGEAKRRFVYEKMKEAGIENDWRERLEYAVWRMKQAAQRGEGE